MTSWLPGQGVNPSSFSQSNPPSCLCWSILPSRDLRPAVFKRKSEAETPPSSVASLGLTWDIYSTPRKGVTEAARWIWGCAHFQGRRGRAGPREGEHSHEHSHTRAHPIGPPLAHPDAHGLWLPEAWDAGTNELVAAIGFHPTPDHPQGLFLPTLCQRGTAGPALACVQRHAQARQGRVGDPPPC